MTGRKNDDVWIWQRNSEEILLLHCLIRSGQIEIQKGRTNRWLVVNAVQMNIILLPAQVSVAAPTVENMDMTREIVPQ